MKRWTFSLWSSRKGWMHARDRTVHNRLQLNATSLLLPLHPNHMSYIGWQHSIPLIYIMIYVEHNSRERQTHQQGRVCYNVKVVYFVTFFIELLFGQGLNTESNGLISRWGLCTQYTSRYNIHTQNYTCINREKYAKTQSFTVDYIGENTIYYLWYYTKCKYMNMPHFHLSWDSRFRLFSQFVWINTATNIMVAMWENRLVIKIEASEFVTFLDSHLISSGPGPSEIAQW